MVNVVEPSPPSGPSFRTLGADTTGPRPAHGFGYAGELAAFLRRAMTTQRTRIPPASSPPIPQIIQGTYWIAPSLGIVALDGDVGSYATTIG